MQCKNHYYASFVKRHNRFLATVKLNDNHTLVKAHVPDPGRLKELLYPSAEVIVRKEPLAKNSARKTEYTLIGVRTGNIWVNIESQLANKLFQKDFSTYDYFRNYSIVRTEFSWGTSRFDFLLKAPSGKLALLEVKSVTLVKNNLALFPDAPTSRGSKHLQELMLAKDEGMEGILVFIVKREDAEKVAVNKEPDPKFASTLEKALQHGVKVVAFRYQYVIDNCPKIVFQKEIPFLPSSQV